MNFLKNKQTRSDFITYGLVIVAFLVVFFMQTNHMIPRMFAGQLVPITAYIVMAISLNLVVGVAGDLSLGHAGFMSIGAYTGIVTAVSMQAAGAPQTLALVVSIVVGAVFAAIAGFIIGIPVLRLRGDYLAIVTLGFGEIVRLVLLNWTSVTGGSRGISGIPRPEFFGIEMDLTQKTTYLYYLSLIAVVITIVVITRLKNSRVGMALQAMREDEIASEAMGINLTRVKLTAFALSSAWAGFAGVLFAAKTQFINPASFTFMDSCMILAMVVLGGMGSILGVTIGALILILVPEYLRAFSDYRMLLFGATMVVMMLFRPQGIITGEKRHYRISVLHNKEERA